MHTPLDSLLSSIGKTRADYPTKSKIGKIFHRGGVRHTEELDRILALPRYRWQDDKELENLGYNIERWLGLPFRSQCKRKCGHDPQSKDCPECIRANNACTCHGEGVMRLRLVQVAALQAIHDFGGMLGPIRVGGGKTLISFLAPSVIDAERTLLLLPAKLIRKTERDFARLARHWVAPKNLHIISYELLSRDRGLRELNAYKPKLIIADEAQKLKGHKSACTRRINRYLNETEQKAIYVDMSGTITKRSIMEYYHRQNWALPDGLQPLPRSNKQASEWADAIDAMSPQVERTKRLAPGALYQLCTDDDIRELSLCPKKTNVTKTVRAAYQRRLMSAPGVVGTEEQFDGAMPIIIQAHEFEPGESVIDAFRGLRDDWCMPDGQSIDMPPTLWRMARQLSQGFYYKWDPPPPDNWLMARREWSATVRDILKRYRDIDTPMLAARAVDEGRISWAIGTLERWRKLRPSFQPNTIAEWIDDACLLWAAEWAKKNRGIIWVNEIAFGEKLSEVTGIPYYRTKGVHKGKMIEDETGTCIASIASNAEGRNLQQFSQNLVISCPPGGAIWEQKLGRTHRDGQIADEVTVDMPLVCYEQWSVFCNARRDAEYIERTTGQAQKLNFADVTIQEPSEIATRHGSGDPLWCKDNVEFFENEEWT